MSNSISKLKGVLRANMLSNYSDQQLYKDAKRRRDLLMKRKKRLEQAIDKNPHLYSKAGLQKLQDIPMVSTSDGRNALKANIAYMSQLENMRTGTATGAKQHREEVLRISAGLPKTGKLDKEQKRIRDEALTRVKAYDAAGVDVLTEFWNGFELYKSQNVTSTAYDSNQQLKEYQEVFNAPTGNGADIIDSLYQRIIDYTTQQYEQRKVYDPLDEVKREGGWL